MRFFKSTALLLSFVTLSVLALPTTTERSFSKRALVDRSYSEIQISDGVAGNAAAEAIDKFPVDPATASSEDLQVVKRASQLVGDAENLAFLVEDDQSQEAQNGFIKNKVLKNYLGLLALQIQKAQGANIANIDSRIEGEQTKLATNTATDEEHAGEASRGVEFDG